MDVVLEYRNARENRSKITKEKVTKDEEADRVEEAH